MWDPHQERWFGASIAVSYSSMRIFSVHSELSYIAAFCDVVLAEIWRLEAQELGRSKNNFVSSISHELRSPLGTALRTTHVAGRSTDGASSTLPCPFAGLNVSCSEILAQHLLTNLCANRDSLSGSRFTTKSRTDGPSVMLSKLLQMPTECLNGKRALETIGA